MNLPINEPAVPVVAKTNIAFSISIAIKEVFILVGVFNTILTLIVKPNWDDFIHNPNLGNVLLMTSIAFICLAILYAPLLALLSRESIIPIYNSETITDPGMVNNIIATFKTKTDNRLDRILRNFKHPSWSADIVPIYNEIVMTFYDTTRIISDKLDNITNEIASMRLSIYSISNNQIVFEHKIDELKISHGELKASHDALKEEMRAGFDEIKMMLQRKD